MGSVRLTESVVGETAPDWLKSLDWAVKYGPEIVPGGLGETKNKNRTDRTNSE